MTHQPRSLRFGLVGTGYWARTAHAPALAAAEGIEFSAVWGRNQDAAASLAARYGATAHGDLDSLLTVVDAVALSVPPDVQAAIGARAARAGKHLLLEKPIAISAQAAADLAAAVRSRGRLGRLLHAPLPAGDPRLAGRCRPGRRLGGRPRGVAGLGAAGREPVQHSVAAGEWRPLGPGPARSLAAVGHPGAR